MVSFRRLKFTHEKIFYIVYKDESMHSFSDQKTEMGTLNIIQGIVRLTDNRIRYWVRKWRLSWPIWNSNLRYLLVILVNFHLLGLFLLISHCFLSHFLWKQFWYPILWLIGEKLEVNNTKHVQNKSSLAFEITYIIKSAALGSGILKCAAKTILRQWNTIWW